MIKFTAVMPIHNEQRMLWSSLPSLYALQPNETILVFDRCSDASQAVAQKIADRCGCLDKTRFLEVNEPCDWSFRVAYLRTLGFREAGYDSVLTTDADIILDPHIKNHFGLLGKNGVATVVFEYVDYPVNFRNTIKRLCEHAKLPFPWLSAIRLFSRGAWLETADNPHVKELESAEDTYWHRQICEKHKARLVLSDCVHLRPRENRENHYLRGRMYWKATKRSFLTTFLSAVMLFRPFLLKGYIHERFGS